MGAVEVDLGAAEVLDVDAELPALAAMVSGGRGRDLVPPARSSTTFHRAQPSGGAARGGSVNARRTRGMHPGRFAASDGRASLIER